MAGAPDDLPAPNGLVFHLSRCGSTLAAQMLAAMPGHGVVSEAQPIDAFLHLDLPVAALRAMVAALTRGEAS